MATSLLTPTLRAGALPAANHSRRCSLTNVSARAHVAGKSIRVTKVEARKTNSSSGRRSLVAHSGGRGFLADMAELDEPDIAKVLEYEVPLSVIKYPDPRLRAENSLVGVFDETLTTLAREMFNVMYKTDGVGLAAPQVGVNVRLMVYNPEGHPQQGPEHVLVNPRIVKTSKKIESYEEGCLSFPLMLGKVLRPASVKFAYQDMTGKKKKMELQGWEARIFLHEYDHLEGKLFHDRMDEEVLAQVGPELKKFEQEFEEQSS